MRHFFIFLLAFLTTYFSVMGQQQEPKILFQKQANFLLQEREDTKFYLTDVKIIEPTNNYVSYAKMDSVEFSKVEFTMVFNVQIESKLSRSTKLYVVQFAKDSTNYKIFEWFYLTDWDSRQNENSPFFPMSYEARIYKEYTFIGYSDNETLLAVKVWNYVKDHFDEGNAILKNEEK